MASTRNKNTPGDYRFEQQSIQKQSEYKTYIHGPAGESTQTYFPGDGLVGGRFAPTLLSNNACDIESYLYGIGSTNLVNPLPELTPNIKSLQSLNIIQKTPLLFPNPLIVEPNQRPQPLPL
jgi:hypothetical protein